MSISFIFAINCYAGYVKRLYKISQITIFHAAESLARISLAALKPEI